ncbi:MAG: FecR domain-containing protein [Bacteroidota bacterium]
MSDKYKDETFLARWLSGQLSPEELAAFEQSKDFALFEKIAVESEQLELPAREDEATRWGRLSQEMEQHSAKKPTKTRRLHPAWMAAAAGVLLLILAYVSLSPPPLSYEAQTYATANAAKELFVLPDGSEIWMNAASELSYVQETFANDRLIEFRGEAFFKVVKGADFRVKTPNGEVRVLGTSFNVHSRTQQMDVSCFTGKVEVQLGQSLAPQQLEAGDRVRSLPGGGQQRLRVDAGQEQPSWIAGESRFDNANFVEVVAELEFQYDLTVEYPESLLEEEPYTGGFPHDDLESALKIVFASAAYQYQIDGKVVRIFQ